MHSSSTTKFRDLTTRNYWDHIKSTPNALSTMDIIRIREFLYAYPAGAEADERFPLKVKFKPDAQTEGPYSAGFQGVRAQEESIRSKIYQNRLGGEYLKNGYEPVYASFKLHVSINNIVQQDAELIKDFLRYLVEASQAERSLAYYFKMVRPEDIDPAILKTPEQTRMLNTDQFTIYLDKYSSLADMLRFTEELNTYLGQRFGENTMGLGLKDSI